jgi:hypothetical protein
MNRLSIFVFALGCTSLLGCGSDSEKETGTDSTLVGDDVGLSPQAGDWQMTTAAWVNDDCNFGAALAPPSSVTFADVTDTTFSPTMYDSKGMQIGETRVECTYGGDNAYNCTGFGQTLVFTDNGILDMVGTDTITMNSETSVTGAAILTADCTGTDCGMMAATTNSGSFPCTSGLDWTAAAP